MRVRNYAKHSCGAHLVPTQALGAVGCTGARLNGVRWTDTEISSVFSGPSAFSEPWFSSPEMDFRTLCGNLRWCVTSLINTHPMEQRSTRLRAEIGFSGIFIFWAPTPISEPWFSMSEAEFWTLSEVLSWFVTILTNTHRVEKCATRLRAEIGFSEILIFELQRWFLNHRPRLKIGDLRWRRDPNDPKPLLRSPVSLYVTPELNRWSLGRRKCRAGSFKWASGFLWF